MIITLWQKWGLRAVSSTTHRRSEGAIRSRFVPQLEPLEHRNLLATTLSVGPNIDLGHFAGNQSAGSITINPTNPQNLFAVSSDASFSRLIAYSSTDGGNSWSSQPLADGSGGIPIACSQGQVAFDQFGNLFVCYLSFNRTSVDLIMSTNGGQTFTLLNTFSDTFGNPPTVDRPSVATGPGSVWVSWSNTLARGIVLETASVSCLGGVGGFTLVQLLGTNSAGLYSDVAVGRASGMVVAYQAPDGYETGGHIYTSSGVYDENRLATATNVGTSDDIPADSVTSQPNPPNPHGLDAEPKLAFDNSGGPHDGRVYLVYTDEVEVPGNSDTTDTDIMLRYSDNIGALYPTWSAPIRVNDDTGTNSQFLPAVAVDQSTGNVAVTWYDARNDLGNGGPGDTDPPHPNDDAELFGTISTNGGTSFLPNVQIAAGPTNSFAAQNGIGIGDYTGLAFLNGVLYPIWADNSAGLTGPTQNTDRPNLDMATAAVRVITNLTITPTNGISSNGPPYAVTNTNVATFIDANGPQPLGSYSALIYWGDGTAPTAGQISQSGNQFTVTGSHTWAEPAKYTIVVSIRDASNNAAAATETAVIGAQNDRFVAKIYVDLFRRPADAQGLANNIAQITQNGLTRQQLTQAFVNNDEYKRALIKDWYRWYLGRDANGSEVTSWLNKIDTQGYSDELVQANILGSTEYYNGHGQGTNSGFVSALYNDVLERPADSGGLSYWVGQMNGGMSAYNVALAFLTGSTAEEHRVRFVKDAFFRYLRRAADPYALGPNGWVGAMDNGATDEYVVVGLVSSTEYFNNV